MEQGSVDLQQGAPSRRSSGMFFTALIGGIVIVVGGTWAYFIATRPDRSAANASGNRTNAAVSLGSLINTTMKTDENTNDSNINRADNSNTNSSNINGAKNTNTGTTNSNTNASAGNSNSSGTTNVNAVTSNTNTSQQSNNASLYNFEKYLCYLSQNPTSIQDVPAGHIREYLTYFATGAVVIPSETEFSCSQYSASQMSEAAASVQIDADGDGLPKIFEDAYLSDDTKADSDGDGFSDLAEINNGYDPIYSGGVTLETSSDPAVIYYALFKCVQDRKITVAECAASGVGF